MTVSQTIDLTKQTHEISEKFPPGSKISLDQIHCDKGLVGEVVGYRIVRLRNKQPEMRLSVDVPGDHWVLDADKVSLIE